MILKKYKKEIVILGLLILIPLILLGIYYLIKGPIEKKDSKNGSSRPYIDISSVDSDAINDYIEKLYKEYTTDGKSKFNYKVFEYNDIISILIIIDQYDKNRNDYIRKYMSFNVDKNGSFIDKEKLARLFNYELEDIVTKVDDRLKEYYNQEINKEYVDEHECNYDCYLSYVRGITNILDNISLVIENNKLTGYINLNIDDISNDQKFFDSLNYNPYRIVIE